MKQRIILIICVVIASIGIILGSIKLYQNYQNKNKTDAIKFSEEYTQVPNDNIFVYKSSDEIIKILEHGTGIVYLGFPECPWCQRYAKYLNEVAKENGASCIYYYNILDDRKNNTEIYQKIVSLLSGNLLYDDNGNERIYVPDVTFVYNGKIVGHDNESSYDTKGFEDPNDYWNDEAVTNLKNRLTDYTKKVCQTMCTECNKD
jgi:glutaredoxin